MPKPADKQQLLQQSTKTYTRLNSLIESMSPVDRNREFPPGTLNRNIRDVLAHLHHWHLMLLTWYKEGMQRQKPPMPAPGYTWKDTPELNRSIQSTYHTTPLGDIRSQLDRSHNDVMNIILNHSNEELFEKKRYPWTGSTSMAAYLTSATSSHYIWALKLISRCLT